MAQNCDQIKLEADQTCYTGAGTLWELGVRTSIVKNAREVTDLIRTNLQTCVHTCLNDQICDCLELCSVARSHLTACSNAKMTYVSQCSGPSADKREIVAQKFAILEYRQLLCELDRDLESMVQSLKNEYSENPEKKAYIGKHVQRLNQILGNSKFHAVMNFVESINLYDSETMKFSMERYAPHDEYSDHSFSDGDSIPDLENEDGTTVVEDGPPRNKSTDLVHRFVSAIKFDQTMFIRVAQITHYLVYNHLKENSDPTYALIQHSEASMVELLEMLCKNSLVWSFLRLPSSMSVCTQLLMGKELLNTSKTEHFSFQSCRKQIMTTLSVALDYPHVLDILEEYDDLFRLRIRKSRFEEWRIPEKYRKFMSEIHEKEYVFGDGGFLPTPLVELVTRGDYGTVLLRALGESIVPVSKNKVIQILNKYDEQIQMPPESMRLYLQSQGVGGANMKRGGTMFELTKLDPERPKSLGDTKLVRGDYNLSQTGQVSITTSEHIDTRIWRYVFLPVDETMYVPRGRNNKKQNEHFEVMSELLPKDEPNIFTVYVGDRRDEKLVTMFPITDFATARSLPMSDPDGLHQKHTWTRTCRVDWIKV